MKSPIVIVGIGEIAAVLAHAFLRSGHPVYPVTRSMEIAVESETIPEPKMVVVAVAEADYEAVMEAIPDAWQDRLVLIQNELLPKDWERFGIQNPTIASIWFEKKRGTAVNPILPTPVFGPIAPSIVDALRGIGIPADAVVSSEAMLLELVQKNVYILTSNIAGLALQDGATVSDLWKNNRSVALAVANDVIDLQCAVLGESLDRERLLAGLERGIEGDPNHICKGRSAPGRLARALEQADAAGVQLRAIRELASRLE